MVDLRPYKNILAPLAFDPKESRGRRHSSELDNPMLAVLDPFISDIIAILDSKALRRLADKTQVFPSPNNPHVRTRLIHTGEVVATALFLADILGLNRELCQAIAWGHDLGHTTFGHLGETVVSELLGRNFQHSVLSVVVAQQIERRGAGLDLSWEVLSGIARHSGGRKQDYRQYPMEIELVRIADKLTFTFADLLDINYYGFGEENLPELLWWFGKHQRDQMNKCIEALVQESAERGMVSFEHSETAQKFEELRRWPYDNLYHRFETETNKRILKDISAFLARFYEGCEGPLLLALLTDKEAIELHNLLMLHPNDLGIKKADIDALHLGINDIVSHLAGREIDMTDPDLDWGRPVI